MARKVQYVPPAFFLQDAPIRPYSKISRRNIPRICFGFCTSLSIALAAQQSGLSRRTMKEFYAELRALLQNKRFQRWHRFEAEGPYEFPELPVIAGEIWRQGAKCYQNATCFRNFQYGNRKTRECKNCPLMKSELLHSYIDADNLARLYKMVDQTAILYRDRLHIFKESGYEPAELFRLRAYHSTIVWTALEASSTRTAAGRLKCDPSRGGYMTVHSLWLSLLEEVEAKYR